MTQDQTTDKELYGHWFIGDLHIAHEAVLRYDSRPWETIGEHDEALTCNVMSKGHPNRTLWLMGDVAFRREALKSFVERIRPCWGRIHLIRGNHDDRVAWQLRDLFDESHEARYLRISKEHRFYLSHYAHRVWRNSHHGSYHLYAHSHGALPGAGRSLDCGAPCIGYVPVSAFWAVNQLKYNPIINHHE